MKKPENRQNLGRTMGLVNEFVTKATCKELARKKEALRRAYRLTKKDAGQLEAKKWKGVLGDTI